MKAETLLVCPKITHFSFDHLGIQVATHDREVEIEHCL
mgnify:CR=1 FL=1